MPKKRSVAVKAPTHTDEFIKWVSDTVPEGVRVYAHVTFSNHREGGRAFSTYEIYLSLKRGQTDVSKSSHSFAVLARWIRDEALPELFPQLPPMVRKITVERPKLEHHPIERLFD